MVNQLRIKASPYARKLAQQSGLMLDDVAGTGPEGRIIARDIQALQTPPAVNSEGRSQITLGVDVDFTQALLQRERYIKDGFAVTVADLLLLACASSGFERIGVTTSISDLRFPVVDTRDLSPIEIIEWSHEQTQRWDPEAHLAVEADLVILDLGSLGVEVVSLPRLLGAKYLLQVGALQQRVVAIAGGMAVRPILALRLSANSAQIRPIRIAETLRRVRSVLEDFSPPDLIRKVKSAPGW